MKKRKTGKKKFKKYNSSLDWSEDSSTHFSLKYLREREEEREREREINESNSCFI